MTCDKIKIVFMCNILFQCSALSNHMNKRNTKIITFFF
jgi:hypothetical protein